MRLSGKRILSISISRHTAVTTCAAKDEELRLPFNRQDWLLKRPLSAALASMRYHMLTKLFSTATRDLRMNLSKPVQLHVNFTRITQSPRS
ncbi:hypothetical protein KC344_g171 [Hortaea werneckii]|nr:hypothetical protein KC344_g171 [Hortaea werneckii]